ncbi:hypothetical protein ACMFMG_007526 [Clarireedia jacksonii]
MNTKEYLQDVLLHLFFPLQFMFISLSYLPGAILSLLSSDPTALTSVTRTKDAWFAHFWGKVGPQVRQTASVNAAPIIKQARGVVLDIGPGSGEWLRVFDKSKVTKIYGVEPNRDHYAILRRRIEEAGLTDVYEIVEGGVEDLTKWGIGEETVDSIVTILCLCSVDRPEEMMEVLYGKLKKGGIWLLYEHVLTKQGGWVKWYQALIDIPWPHFLGGCSITRDTERSLKKAGAWSKVDLAPPVDEPSYKILPHIKGSLEK